MLFSVLEPRLERLLQELRDEAVRLLALWVIEDDCGNLREGAGRVQAAANRLMDAVPRSALQNTELGRHVHFLGYYLGKNQKENCNSDIYNIVVDDLPAVEAAIRKGTMDRWPSDPELRGKTMELLEVGHAADSIRNAFVVLSERLRGVKRGLRERDGHALVEELFGEEGRLVAYMNDAPRRGLRNLLLGLYSRFRNPHAHRRMHTTPVEATALVLMIDRLLGDLTVIKRTRKRRPRSSTGQGVVRRGPGVTRS